MSTDVKVPKAPAAPYEFKVKEAHPSIPKDKIVTIRLITHNGGFHADEIAAIAVILALAMFLRPELEIILVRTRDKDFAKPEDWVFDVNQVYDHAKHRYDHHQPSFTGCYTGPGAERVRNNAKKMSSIGLVWTHFAAAYVHTYYPNLDEKATNAAIAHLFVHIINGLDCHDNGIQAVITSAAVNYDFGAMTMGRFVSSLNGHGKAANDDVAQMPRFLEAVKHVQTVMKMELDGFMTKYPERTAVEAFVDALKTTHKSGRVLFVTDDIDYRAHLHSIEAERKFSPNETVLYAIVESKKGDSVTYKLNAVAVAGKFTVNRKKFPASLFLLPPTGTNDKPAFRDMKEVDAIIGEPGTVFMHKDGFIGEHKTKKGAFAIIDIALASDTPVTEEATQEQLDEQRELLLIMDKKPSWSTFLLNAYRAEKDWLEREAVLLRAPVVCIEPFPMPPIAPESLSAPAATESAAAAPAATDAVMEPTAKKDSLTAKISEKKRKHDK